MSARGFGSGDIASASSGNIASPPVTSMVNNWRIIGSATGTPIQAVVDPASGDTNVSAVVGSPKGTGALQAQVNDAAATGGNARGANAVDWQTLRAAAAQVASGASSVLAGGNGNTASGSEAVVGGGNTNVASGQRAFVGGGVANVASGVRSVIGGGNGNSVNAVDGTISGGTSNTTGGAGASLSWVPGGGSASARGLYGRGAWGSGVFATVGDAQSGEFLLRRQTTDATATRVTGDAAAASTANTLNLPNFSAYAGAVTVVAKKTGTTDAATWRLPVSAVRGNGVATVVVYEGAATAIVPTASNGTGSTWRLDIAADTTNGGIAITVTGVAATTINTVARFADVETVTAS